MAIARILVIDDEPLIRSALKRALRQHEVVEAGSGMQAIEWIGRGDRFDLVLCDLMMPGLDGVEVYENVRSMRASLAERFVFVTAGATTERTQTFLETTELPCVTKPFSPGALRASVGALLAAFAIAA